MTFNDEQKSQILKEARSNSNTPRYMPRHAEPPVPDKVAEWRREAEQAAAIREATQLTDSIAARVMDNLRSEFDGKLQYEHRFILDVVKGALEHVMEQLSEEISEQVGQLRAEIHVDKAHAKIIDMPSFLPARRAAS
jgi:hypothetical protein